MDNQAFDDHRKTQFPPSGGGGPSSSGWSSPPQPNNNYNPNPPNYYPPQQGYPAQPALQGYPAQPAQGYPVQPAQQVVVVGAAAAAPVFIPTLSVQFGGAIAMSCIVFWFCGWLFGLIAFILAMVGQSSAAAGDTTGAIQLRNASYGVSIAGLVLGIIGIAIIAGVYGSYASRVAASCRTYYYSNGVYYSYYYTC